MMVPEDLSRIPDVENNCSWSSDISRLLKAIDDQSLDALEALLSKGAPVNAHGGAFHETPLHKAAKQGWMHGVQVLLANGATANSMNQYGQTPLHYACASKFCDCIKSLLDSGCNATLDHRDMRGHTPLHDAASVGYPEGVVLLLKAGANVDIKDINEETALYKAAKARCLPSMLALLNHGADMGARDKTGESSLSYVLRHLPAGMDSLLDRCLIPNSNKLSSKKLEVSFNLVPLAGSSEMNQMRILNNVVDLGHPKLLLHPVCEAFLLLKWHTVRKLFFIEVIFYFVHAFLATFLILDKFVWQGVDETFPDSMPPTAFHVLKIILLILAVIILLKQVLTIIQGIRSWIFSLWNVLNAAIPMLVFIVVLGQRDLWQHHFATITLLLIWVQCMLHIGRFPGCGIYVAMFTRVAKVFLRMFLIFFCLLLAFSLSFYVAKYGGQYSKKKMVANDSVYISPSTTFIKTLTMMIGELDFDSVFVDQLGELPYTSHIIYLAFVIFVSIILSNLLVALAVNDVQGLRNSAHLERLIKQMELVFQMEKTFCSLISLASMSNFLWLNGKIRLFVHDFSKTKVFVQPFHPQKGSKLFLVERGQMKEIGLRKAHVSNMMECLRLQEEENASSPRKLSVRKSRPVRSEYASFSGGEDDLRDFLKALERNLLESLGEKIDDTTTTLASLSLRLRVLEEIYHKSGGENEGGNSSSGESTSYSIQRQQLSNHVFHPSTQGVALRSHHMMNNSGSLRHPLRHSQPTVQQQQQPKKQQAKRVLSHQPLIPIHQSETSAQQQQQQQQQPPNVLQQQQEPPQTDNYNVQFEMVAQRSVSLPTNSLDIPSIVIGEEEKDVT